MNHRLPGPDKASEKGGEKVLDTPARGAKRFLVEYQSLYDKCREEVLEVVHPIFWPS